MLWTSPDLRKWLCGAPSPASTIFKYSSPVGSGIISFSAPEIKSTNSILIGWLLYLKFKSKSFSNLGEKSTFSSTTYLWFIPLTT